jgi:hypothetical protein
MSVRGFFPLSCCSPPAPKRCGRSAEKNGDAACNAPKALVQAAWPFRGEAAKFRNWR